MRFGSHSMVGAIKRILVKHPKDAWVSQARVEGQSKELQYAGCPDYGEAIREYDQFLNLLRREIPEVHYLPPNEETGLDSIYVFDPVIVTDRGAILCNMGKPQRRREPAAVAGFLPELAIPVLGAISGDGILEGGDVLWLDEHTLAVGRGYRTNDEGIRQLKELTAGLVDEFVVVSLPHWRGPGEVLHLLSLVSPIDDDLALAYSKLLPVPFREWLLRRGMRLLEVPDSEFETLACNVLAVSPRKCVMLSGNPRTREMLIREGVEVLTYDGEEICLKGSGGPTCLTRPILRE